MVHISALLDNPETWQKIIKHDRKGRKDQKPNKKKPYNNKNIITFDTETTSYIKDNGDKCGFIYIWQVCVNGYCFYGRYITEFTSFMEKLNEEYNTNVIWVQNFSFEFAFIRANIHFDYVFARTEKKPIFARWKNIEFRCTYFLTHMSLANIAYNFKTEHKKLKGDLDYTLARMPETPLEDKNLDYCRNDVLVLYDYIHGLLVQNGWKIKKIPYTQTGYVRQEFLEFLTNNKLYYQQRKIVQQLAPTDFDLFRFLENAFWGGITHANYKAVLCGVYENIPSFDMTSSYPHSMCAYKYPMTPFKEIVTNKNLYVDNDNFAWVACVGFYDIESKTTNGIISKHKCVKIERYIEGKDSNGKIIYEVPDSNGRIVHAKYIELYCTDLDYKNICDMYNFSDMEIGKMYVSKYDYLPLALVNFVLHLYSQKTALKGVKGEESLYAYFKQLINSVYGMCVLNPFSDDITYTNDEWGTEKAQPEKLEKYYKNKKTVLVYQWGVWVVARSRRKLVTAMCKIGNDCLYVDTDSIKYTGDFKNIFEHLNNEIHEQNMKVCKERNIDVSMFMPKDRNGNTHELGLWEHEYTAKRFKTLGCKRYVVEYADGSIHATVAGVDSKQIEKYLLRKGGNWYDNFNNDLELPAKPKTIFYRLTKRRTVKKALPRPRPILPTYSNKNILYYIEDKEGETITVKDYKGCFSTIYVSYGIYVESTTFHLSRNRDYIKFLMGHEISEYKTKIRKGVYQ